MNNVIIRADDLGYSRGVNYGIADAVNRGIITSVGVMTNMEEAEAGLAMLDTSKVCLGLHTNVCAGRPLSAPEKIPSITRENGEFKSSKTYRAAYGKEDFVDLDEVILEIEAQYERFIELVGRKPDYFEGHAISSDNFYRGLEIVAARHGCAYLPFDMNNPVPFKNGRVFLEMESVLPDYDPEVTLKKIVQKEYPEDVIPVMVCHPGYLDAWILKTSSMTTPRVLEAQMACSPEIKAWLQENQVQVLSFNDLH